MLGKHDVVVQDENGEIDVLDPLHISNIHFLGRANGKARKK